MEAETHIGTGETTFFFLLPSKGACTLFQQCTLEGGREGEWEGGGRVRNERQRQRRGERRERSFLAVE